ncbi:hypothetical protein ACFQGT_07220 [Natrialbaceae archaeon GCM10025810]|uniref:DUF7310 family coiled-coil domain-containing protein n=1 Tax=Halovalidus salilacus TaxID=3075124 RepID=UPI003612ADA5
MTDIDRLDRRLAAVERVVVDGDVALDELGQLTSLTETVADLETRGDEHERRLADLEAAVQSIEGYVGTVESINDGVERRAASAVATVDRLERRVEALETDVADLEGGILEADSPSDEADADGDGFDGDTEDDASETAGESTDDVGAFEFGFDDESTPERSVRNLVEGDGGSRPIAADGADHRASSANQTAVDSAVDDGVASATDDGAVDRGLGSEDHHSDEEGLLASLRARFA